jgi:hypothetical protein
MKKGSHKKKVQKKYYLSEEVGQLVRMASARSGFSESAIVEAALVLHIVKHC